AQSSQPVKRPDSNGAISGVNIDFKDKLGNGPCGASYSGVDRSNDKLYALKVLSSKFAKHPEILAQITGDLKKVLSAQIHIDHAANLLLIFEREGRTILVSDLCSANSLSSILGER